MLVLPYLKVGSIGILLWMVSSFSNKHQVANNFDELTGTWIDTVFMHSLPRADEVTIDLYTGVFFVDEIDSTFFKHHLDGFETAFPRNWKIEFDPYSRYYFFDYQRYESWVSFTILHNTEYGYNDFYTYTYDLTLKKITSVSCIAQIGSDGGARSKDYLFFTDSGRKLTVRTQSYYDQDIDYDGGLDHCYTRSFYSIVSNIEFFQDRTEFSIDTVFSKLDTICV